LESPNCLGLIQDTSFRISKGTISVSNEQIGKLVDSRPGPLGRYFEALIETVFLSCPEIESLHTNIPVRDGQTTKGEFDLLYKYDGAWRHLEMAIKFYLGAGDPLNAFDWHGPAQRDTLGRKLQRMSHHQLTLPDTDAGRATLQSLHIDHVKGESLVLGRLFYPYAFWQQQKTQAPQGIAPDHAKGWWVRSEDMPVLSLNSGIYWQALTKPDWLAPASGMNSQKKPQSDFFNVTHPTQFAVLSRSGTGVFQEISRGFVVPAEWGRQSMAK